jgi:heme oxygenase
VDDAKFASTLAEVTSVAKKAHAAISKGDLADAHEILEKIRDLLGDLRSRNGIVTFSDRMNAYHEAMEHILTKPYEGYDAKGWRTYLPPLEAETRSPRGRPFKNSSSRIRWSS